MMRFWIVAALTAVTLAVTGCGGATARGDKPQGEAARSKEGTATMAGLDPDDELSGLRTEVDQTQTADGAMVTLDWAYADEKFVAVRLDTRVLDDPQKPEESESGSGPGYLEPSLWDDTVGNEAELPPYVKITDGSGQDFDLVGGGTNGSRAEAVFDAPEGIEAGPKHSFRLEVPLHDSPALTGKPEAGPFVFRFEVPVWPAPTIEVDQEVEAKGVTLTLERVINSPVVPQAVVCFEPPDDEHSWMPFFKYEPSSPGEVGSAPQQLGNGCWSIEMGAPVEGRSSVTVAMLWGILRGPVDPSEDSEDPKTIRGPWTFEFEAPSP